MLIKAKLLELVNNMNHLGSSDAYLLSAINMNLKHLQVTLEVTFWANLDNYTAAWEQYLCKTHSCRSATLAHPYETQRNRRNFFLGYMRLIITYNPYINCVTVLKTKHFYCNLHESVYMFFLTNNEQCTSFEALHNTVLQP